MSALTLWTSAVDVGRDAGDDRDAAGLDQVEDGFGTDVRDLADEAEVDLLAVDDGVGGLGGEQPGVLAGQADGERTVLVDQADELALHLPDEHHPDDVHRLGRGDAQAAAELQVMSSRLSIAEICGPPPCTTTGLKPAKRRNAMSSANAFLRASSVMALPPYFTTIVLPWYCFSHGSAAARVCACVESS